MQTADRTIAGLAATIEEVDAQVAVLADEVATVGTEISNKEKDLLAATTVRKAEKADFDKAEKELSESVDQLERAVLLIKKGTALVQSGSPPKVDPKKAMDATMKVFAEIIDSGRIEAGMKRKLENFVQTEGK